MNLATPNRTLYRARMASRNQRLGEPDERIGRRLVMGVCVNSGIVEGPVLAPEPCEWPTFRVFDAMILIAGSAPAISGGLRLFANLSEFFIYLCRTIAAYHSDLYSKHPSAGDF